MYEQSRQSHGTKNRDDEFIAELMAVASGEESKWQSKRRKTHYYRMNLRPGKTVKLQFKTNQKKFFIDLNSVAGRDYRFTDLAATSRSEILPEVGDPMQ